MADSQRWLFRSEELDYGAKIREWWIYTSIEDSWGMKVLTFPKDGRPQLIESGLYENEGRYGNAVRLNNPLDVRGMILAQNLLTEWLAESSFTPPPTSIQEIRPLDWDQWLGLGEIVLGPSGPARLVAIDRGDRRGAVLRFEAIQTSGDG